MAIGNRPLISADSHIAEIEDCYASIERKYWDQRPRKAYADEALGAFIEILPGTEGLCHISELQESRTEKTEDVLKKGDITKVKLLSIDEKGRLRLSRKAALADEASSGGAESAEAVATEA